MFKRKIKRDQVWRYRVIPVIVLLAVAAGILVVRLITLMGAASNNLRLLYRGENGSVHAISMRDWKDTELDTSVAAPLAYPQLEWASPDGHQQALWERPDENAPTYNLVIVNLDTQERRPIATYNIFDLRSSWSTDSRYLAFSAGHGENTFTTLELYVLDTQTGDVEQLTDNSFTDSAPWFSPDGKSLAYTSAADGIHRLYVMDIATRETRLVSPDTFGWGPVWSPDGKWIAFESNHLDLGGQKGDGDIFVIAPNGTNLQRLTWDDHRGWDRIIGWEY